MRTPILFITFMTSAALLAGCTNDPVESDPGTTTGTDPENEVLAPPEPGKGIQLQMTAKIDSGTESEKCLFVRAPEDDLYVQRDEVRFSPGSHHFLLYETHYTEIPTEKDDGTKVDTSAVFDCSEGATNGWAVKKLVGGSQNADGASILRFPDNVAMHVKGGAILLMNAHYVNASADDLEPEVRINLHTVPKEQVEIEGDILFLYNPFIGILPQQGSRSRMRCPVQEDITLTNFQSHMHARGVGYSAGVVGESPFYENDLWEGVPVKDFGEGKKIAKGSVIDYHCDYDNPNMNEVFQGPRSTDEMCMAIGSFYPKSETTSQCAIVGEDPFETRNIGGEWVGNGEKTCAATMDCVVEAFQGKRVFEDMTLCILDSAPEKSTYVSDAIRCLFTHDNPAADCQPEFGVCQEN